MAKKTNPFTTTLDIVGRVLTSRPDILIKYVTLPPGAGAAYAFADPPKVPKPTIFLPKADMSALGEKAKKKYCALLTHEMLHHDRSSKEALDKSIEEGSFIKDFYNCLEDARIEIDKQKKWIFVGAYEDLVSYRLEKIKEMNSQPAPYESNPWGWLFQAFKYHLPNYGGIPLSDELKEYFHIGMDILNKDDRFNTVCSQSAEGGETLYEIALEIVEAWQLKRNEDFEQGKGAEGNEGSSSNEDSESDQSESSGEENTEESNSENSGSDQSGTSGEENSEGENTGEENGEETDENGRPKNIKKEYEKAQENPTTKIEIDTLGIEVSEEAEKTQKVDNKLRETPKDDKDIYIPYSKDDREIIPKDYPEAYLKIVNDIGLKIVMLRKTLTRILAAQTNTVIERGLRTGQIDSHLFYKVTKNSRRIKTVTTQGRELDTAVTLLLDLSGSMKGHRSNIAARIGALFGEAMSPISNIKFEILGYNSSPPECSDLIRSECGYTRTEIINYWIFKSFDEKWANARNRLGSCSFTIANKNPQDGGSVGGCNVDHENLIHAAKRLYDRKESNKILIVLCDGAPSGHEFTYGGLLPRKLKETVKKVKNAGIKVFCYGIHAPEVKEFYSPDFHLVNNLEDLNEMALKKLGEYLLKG